MTLIAMELTDSNQVNVQYTGRLRNELTSNRAELGADVLLDSTVGVQVKNYMGYNDSSAHGYHLKTKGIKWDTLRARLGESANVESLGDFFAARCYNLPIKDPPPELRESLPKYKAFFENKISNKSGSLWQSVNAFLGANIDKFLTFEEAYQMMVGDDNEEIIKGSY